MAVQTSPAIVTAASPTPAGKEIVLATGHLHLSTDPEETIRAVRVAASIVVIVFDAAIRCGGMAHMALPESRIAGTLGESPRQYVDIALPQFLKELVTLGVDREKAQVKIVGGSQLFNFGGGSGNLLNIGTRNAIAARTLLTREGFGVDRTETGGNKPRTVILQMHSGMVQVSYPGDTVRFI